MLYQLVMSKYIIGIDGGGTKTLGVLWDEKGREIKRIQKGFCNFNVDLKKSKENLESTIEGLINIKNETPTIVIGVSGFSGLKNPSDYENELKIKYNTNVVLRDDGYLALNSVNNKNNLSVVLVISGTGSIVYGLKDDKYYRYGGHGHLLGDEGSSYNVAINAFKYVTNDFDNNTLSDFSKKFMKKTNIEKTEDIKQLVYHNSKNLIASHSKIVDELARENDSVAISIITKAANDLANQIIKILNKMNENEKFILALRGGMLTNSDLFKESLLNYLKDNNKEFIIDTKNNEPVYGALNVMEGKQ